MSELNPTQAMLTDYWYAHYAAGACTLCGNRGVIDTRGVATHAGMVVGRRNYCICPNGQMMRAGGPLLPTEPMRHNTFAELTTQAQRVVEECRREGKTLPKFAVTTEELDELLRANCGPGLPEGATFHGMVVTVVRP